MARAARLKPAGLAAYLLPFAVFVVILAVRPFLELPQWVRFAVELIVILVVSRPALNLRPSRPIVSILLGAGVFFIWIGPEQLDPGWRSLAPFHNSIVGTATATTAEAQKHDALFLWFRVLNSVVAIPILEELFWRGFLLRWLIDRDFESIPLGAWNTGAFVAVALLFASEHGPYWVVGLIAGVIYNWWIVRTGNLWDCILAHAATNACLAAFVITQGRWQYWL